MGMNYYLHIDRCEHCGRGAERIHIGKSSVGWAFALHVVPTHGLLTLSDWERMFLADACSIRNEDGEIVSAADMVGIITDRPVDWQRHPHDDRSMVGHGRGTWDLIAGDFS